jgi:hypothetical protein
VDVSGIIARLTRPAACSLTLLGALFANPASSELIQVDIVGTVFFAGCPYSGMCSPYPLMWGVSGGESMTLRVVYDAKIPLSEDLSEPDSYYAIYGHTIPLQSPLGMEVTFGPYAANVGSGGVPADYYEIDVFDVIEPYPNYPDLSESIGIKIGVAPGSLSLPGPPGFHDLDFKGIHYGLRNFYGEDFLDGMSIPARFPELNWEDILLTVDVHDPIYGQDGKAFLRIESLTLKMLPSVPGLSIGGAVLLASALIAAASRHLNKAV